MNDHRDDSEAFNKYARTFDKTVGNSPVVRGLRQRVYDEIRRLLPNGGSILDINCGTGTDCIALQEMGYRTRGVDLSSEMIQSARRKAPLGSGIGFDVLPFHRLDEMEANAFDLVLSNNSGLNCADDLCAVLTAVHGRLRTDAHFIGVLMPPFSLWETTVGLARRDLHHAFRRGKKGVANIGGTPVVVRYYGESDLRRAASGLYRVERVLGFNIISPSPNSTDFVERHPNLCRVLAEADDAISRIPLIRRWGDQILVVWRKI